MNKSLCESVLTGSEESRRIIIHDSTECNGRPLVKFAVCELVKRCEEVHVFLYEGDSVQWVKGLPASVTARLKVHDCTHALLNADNAMGPMLAHSPAVEKTAAVVVDSLSSLLLCCSPSSLSRWMATLPHLLALLHSDLHTGGVVAQLDYIATSKLVVSCASSPCDQPVGYAGTASTTHRRPSGKILRQSEGYWVSSDCISMVTVDSTRSITTLSGRPVDPAANLTFDLHLSAQEKEARSHVVLPYTSVQQGGGADQQSRGEILYEADEVDFEDSDPDDDLDF